MIKAQNSKSRFSRKNGKVKPVFNDEEDLWGVGLGGGMNSIVR